MRKIPCLVIISLFCLSSILPTVNSIYVEKSTDALENSLDITLQLPISNRWIRIFGGIEWDQGYSVQQTKDGGYIITGEINQGYSRGDFVLIKTDSNGFDGWCRTFTSKYPLYGNSVRQTTDGGYIVAGSIIQDETLYTADVLLIKTDINGIEEWNSTFGKEYYREGGDCVQQTTDGGYIILGGNKDLNYWSDDYNIWLIKTDTNGNEIWNKTFGGEKMDLGNYVEQTTDGGYIIIGKKDGGMGLTTGDIWLIKTDTNGNEIWNVSYRGENKAADGACVQQTTDGGYIITGGVHTFDEVYSNAWLIKTDNKGAEEWNRTFGGVKGDGSGFVRQTTDGGYIISGSTTSYGAGKCDVWLIKTDTNGNEIWNKTFGGTDYDASHSVQQTTDGGYIITGRTASFGAGSADIWLIKTDRKGIANDPPEKPTITGETNGKAGEEYEYTFVSTDPNDDKVSYYVDWGDNSITGWTRTLLSGEYYNSSHNWSEKGEYIIKAKAKDYFGVESDWASLEVSMPKSKAMEPKFVFTKVLSAFSFNGKNTKPNNINLQKSIT